MEKLLSILAVSILVGTSSSNLFNTNLINTKVQSISKVLNNSKFDQNNQLIKRYDSLNFVDEKNLNDASTSTIKNINAKANPNLNVNLNNTNYNYKDELLKVFNNKQLLLKQNNKYEKFLKNTSNYQKSKLGTSFPMNYDGVYFPWWGFGDYFYWYMSSDTIKKIQQFLGWGEPATATALSSLLTSLGIIGPFAPILILMLMALPASFYMDNVISYDDGNGVYVGVSILPSPIIFEVGKQDKYISEVNSFEVDYRFLAADYLTTCIDEQGVNYLLNYYNQTSTDSFADNVIKPYLKSLHGIDHTGAGGSITDQDYTDWSHSFIQNDSFNLENVTHSYLKDFAYYNPNFRSLDIRTKRGYSETVPEDPYDPIRYYYDDTWQIWKNS